MGSQALRKRKDWQKKSGKKAKKAENHFLKAFEEEFQGTDFEIRKKPKEFRDVYVKVKLPSNVTAEI